MSEVLNMNMDVEYYKKLILETLYNGFIRDPSNRIKNADVEIFFGKINDVSNFRIAREQLIQVNRDFNGKSFNSFTF